MRGFGASRADDLAGTSWSPSLKLQISVSRVMFNTRLVSNISLQSFEEATVGCWTVNKARATTSKDDAATATTRRMKIGLCPLLLVYVIGAVVETPPHCI